MSEQGKKYDDGKLAYDLLPIEAMEEVVRVFTEGKKKYGGRNWEKGILFSRNLAASRRHEAAFLKGELRDKETGTVHLANDIVNKLMMLQFVLTGREDLDDLPNNDKRRDKKTPNKTVILVPNTPTVYEWPELSQSHSSMNEIIEEMKKSKCGAV